MKTIIKKYTIISFVLLFFGCSKNNDNVGEFGFLQISDIELVNENEILKIRSVDPVLRVQIMKNNAIFAGHDYAPGQIPEKISMPPGVYNIRVFSPNYYLPEPNNGQPGEAAYYKQEAFTISENKTTLIDLQVPQVNISVRVKLSDDIVNSFTSITTTISANRVLTLSNSDESTYYLSIPQNGKISYKYTGVNNDGETFNSSVKEIEVSGGKHYIIIIDM